MKTSLIINSTDTNGTINKTVTDVNSNTPGSVAHEYGRRLTALTTNNFVGVNRVDKEKLDGNKITPTLTLSKATDTHANISNAAKTNGWYTVDITYDGDGKISADFMVDSGSSANNLPYAWTINANGQLAVADVLNHNGGINTFDGRVGTITVRASETDTCNAVSATFTITKN